MLNEKGFDLWADEYDKSVGLSDEEGSYPFAGYKEVLNTIYAGVLSGTHEKVLDIVFGTGTLTAKLYAQGCGIYGQDFSEKMIAYARKKMPGARLYQGDFAGGLVPELARENYDVILGTYSLHHLSDVEKVDFLNAMLSRLREGGRIYIGDVAFSTRADLEACKQEAGEEWDPDEIYFVYDELKQSFPSLKFQQISGCAGVLTLIK